MDSLELAPPPQTFQQALQEDSSINLVFLDDLPMKAYMLRRRTIALFQVLVSCRSVPTLMLT
jgi:hypothetical protein